MLNNPLLDNNFLSLLDQKNNKEIWAKIIALDIKENPTEEITGRITGGSINVDGTSAIRRSCSLSLIAKEMNINDFYWGLNTKFKVLIGLTNDIDPRYPNIIWFPQGTYVITSFSTSRGINNYAVSIQGKDKMCLLNGEIGGSLTAPIDFGKIEETDADGNLTISDIPIKEIIKEAVHEYAQEPWHNIIINDLDEYGNELLEYRGTKPLYMLVNVNVDGNEVTQITLNDTIKDKDGNAITLYDKKLFPLTDFYIGSITANDYDTVMFNGERHAVAKIEYGQTVGYRLTDITYAGDLIANPGDSLTSVLDKIVQMLGEFEYFYDLDGRFIFQRKKTYINESWNNLTKNEETFEEKTVIDINSTPYSYEFTNNNLIMNFSNNPNIASLRNDFSIWGTRKTVTGSEVPVHLRYAIDKKPVFYRNINGEIFITSDEVKIIEEQKEQWLNIFKEKVKGFNLSYNVPSALNKPVKQDDGSWSPGWWDIRDWYNYYVLINEEEPIYTMKWYSRNDENGCVPAKSVGINSTGYVWLIVVEDDGRFNIQHGSGAYPGTGSVCTLYKTEYTNSNKTQYKTTVVKDNEGKNITKIFYAPYKGCNDQHTYIEFLEGDIKDRHARGVYFYNPSFPSYQDYEDMLGSKVEEGLKNDFNLDISQVNVVDWREIIYQMAKDYRRYNHSEKFLNAVKENNYFNGEYYYPSGYTGYEQYYIDMEGFWRQLYNPGYKIDTAALGGDGPIETKAELNSNGNFDEGIENIYVYPIETITADTLKDTDIDGERLYTPDNTYVLFDCTDSDGITHSCINPFINDFVCDPIEEIKYFRYYAVNPEIPVEISFDVAKGTYPRSLLYIAEESNEKEIVYKRWVDSLFTSTTGKATIDLINIAEKEVEWKLAYINTKENILLQSIKNETIKKYYTTLDDKNEVKYYNRFFKTLNKNTQKGGYFSFKDIDYYYTQYNYFGDENEELKYWNKAVVDSPESLNFWFDFMDTKGEINKYSVSAVGNRPKVVNDSGVKSIYFRETPKVIFVNKNKSDTGWEKLERQAGYSYIQLPDSMLSFFNISAQGKDAQDVLNECLYNDTYCVESVSINMVPIYYLQPNTKIYIRNDDSKIDGEYIVSRFTIPLEYSGTMSISATKVAERIL